MTDDLKRQRDIERRLDNLAKAPRCGAKTRAGGICKQAAIKGRPRCRMHGGARGSGGPLHLIERWTRTGLSTLEYVVTIENPTVWTRAWTLKQEFTRQSEQANRIYCEPR